MARDLRPARGTLRQRAYDTLKANILNGNLRRGERLSETRLMQEFDIGRTPVREALNQLEREGLVVGRPNSGYSVANFDMEAVCDLLVVREGLDAIAAELAAEVATDSDFERLQGVMSEIEALDSAHTRSPETYAKELELGLKVHEVIAEATGNGPLIEIIRRVYDQLRVALWLEVLWIDVWKDAIEEHRAIVLPGVGCGMRDFHFPGRSAVHAMNGMAATSHPLASLHAIETLRDGGNAVDAAIAASAVLAVVEPQSTGIGGDCFALFCPKGSSQVIAFNGSGRSPKAATLERLLALGLKNIAADSVHSVTMPGAIDAWTQLHADHGRLEFARLLKPAIEYARHGYPVYARVRHDWLEAAELLRSREPSRAVFLPNDRVPAEGDLHYQPKLADTLASIANQGARGFYDGSVAEAMTATLKQHGGLHTVEDFAEVRGEYVEPVSTNYRGFDIHQVPPNTQGVTALVMLNILEGYELANLAPLSAERVHLEIE
ncbi:MAG: gamma-glutamyltransferase, partial [Alphaproteobacteria bacterium]